MLNYIHRPQLSRTYPLSAGSTYTVKPIACDTCRFG